MSKEEKLKELGEMMEAQWRVAKHFQKTLEAFAPNIGHHKAAPELLGKTCDVARGLAAIMDVWKMLRDEHDMIDL
jgi:hypothetical protein